MITVKEEPLCFHCLNSKSQNFMFDLSSEFPQLKDQLYFDHSGATIPSKFLLDNWRREVTENVYGNPHSASSPASAAATGRINDIRTRIKRYYLLKD